MRAIVAACFAVLAAFPSHGTAFAAENPPSYELMGFPEGEPGNLERGLLDALLTSYPEKKQAFETEASKAKGNPQETASFAKRWRQQAALLGQQFLNELNKDLLNPNADTIQKMVSPFEEAMTEYVGQRKPPEKQQEIRKLIEDGNNALAHPTLAATLVLRIPEDQVRPYILERVKAARKKSAEGVQMYLNLPQVKDALAGTAPRQPPPASTIPDQATVLEQLRQEAANDPECKKLADNPAAMKACIDAYVERRQQAPGQPGPVVAVPPVGPQRQPTGLQPAPVAGLPADNGFQITAPPSPTISAPPKSTGALLWEKAAPYALPIAGAIAGALLGAFLLAPFLGIGAIFGAVVGAAALGAAGYFVGQKFFGSN